jgi:hypothetical protein
LGLNGDEDALALGERQSLQGLEQAILINSFDFLGHDQGHLFLVLSLLYEKPAVSASG